MPGSSLTATIRSRLDDCNEPLCVEVLWISEMWHATCAGLLAQDEHGSLYLPGNRVERHSRLVIDIHRNQTSSSKIFSRVFHWATVSYPMTPAAGGCDAG